MAKITPADLIMPTVIEVLQVLQAELETEERCPSCAVHDPHDICRQGYPSHAVARAIGRLKLERKPDGQ